LYGKEGLKPWLEKVAQVRKQAKIIRIYFNNHYGEKPIVNALQFKDMISMLRRDEHCNRESYLPKMHKQNI
jgi:uncharacterized protein YecE (DUF72 family)